MPSFPVNGIALHAELDGARGPLVVFLHGALAAGAAFRSQRIALREDARLAFVDLRGHGASTHLGDEVGWETLTHEAMTRDVVQLLDAMAPEEPVHLVGASLGGIVAARVCAERPERVASLALLGTSATASPKRRAYFARLTPETLPLGTQRLAAKWHGEPYWRDLARHLFPQFAAGEPYPDKVPVERLLVLQSAHDELLRPEEADAWAARATGRVAVERPPGDHAFFADGRAGTMAANRALRRLLLEDNV